MSKKIELKKLRELLEVTSDADEQSKELIAAFLNGKSEVDKLKAYTTYLESYVEELEEEKKPKPKPEPKPEPKRKSKRKSKREPEPEPEPKPEPKRKSKPEPISKLPDSRPPEDDEYKDFEVNPEVKKIRYPETRKFAETKFKGIIPATRAALLQLIHRLDDSGGQILYDEVVELVLPHFPEAERNSIGSAISTTCLGMHMYLGYWFAVGRIKIDGKPRARLICKLGFKDHVPTPKEMMKMSSDRRKADAKRRAAARAGSESAEISCSTCGGKIATDYTQCPWCGVSLEQDTEGVA